MINNMLQICRYVNFFLILFGYLLFFFVHHLSIDAIIDYEIFKPFNYLHFQKYFEYCHQFFQFKLVNY